MKNNPFDFFCGTSSHGETTSENTIKIRLGYTDPRLCAKYFLKPNKFGKSGESTPTGRPIFAETVEQTTSESSEKDEIIEQLKNENERLKTELALAQALLDKQDIQLNQDSEKRTVVCIPDDSHAKLPPPENSGSVVHSQIKGNGYSLDRIKGVSISQGEESMSHPHTNDDDGQLYPDDAFFAQVGQAIDEYLTTVTTEKYLEDLCKATYPRKPVFYEEFVEKIKEKT